MSTRKDWWRNIGGGKKLGKHARKREFIKYGGRKRMEGKDGGASFPAQCVPRI